MKKAPRKVYVVDNGFVASKAFSLTDNLGRLLENQVFIDLISRGYDVEKTMFYYRSRNDKEVDFVLREGTRILRLVQVCYDMSSPKTEKREVDSIVECAGELKCDNLVIVTYNDKRTIEKDGGKISLLQKCFATLLAGQNHPPRLQIFKQYKVPRHAGTETECCFPVHKFVDHKFVNRVFFTTFATKHAWYGQDIHLRCIC